MKTILIFFTLLIFVSSGVDAEIFIRDGHYYNSRCELSIKVITDAVNDRRRVFYVYPLLNIRFIVPDSTLYPTLVQLVDKRDKLVS